MLLFGIGLKLKLLLRHVGTFAIEQLPILVGAPGLAKTRTVRRVLGDRACWIEGNATAFGMYVALWQHKDQLVVVDDVDKQKDGSDL